MSNDTRQQITYLNAEDESVTETHDEVNVKKHAVVGYDNPDDERGVENKVTYPASRVVRVDEVEH